MREFKFAIFFLFAGLCVIHPLAAQDDLPPLNRTIIEYVETVIGEQVDRGECWDLAYQALNRADAGWDGQFKFGREVNPKRREIFPGDIIQFRNVKVRYREGDTIYTETMGQHTAIVYRVIDRGVYELAHQNTGFSGRTVGISKFDLDTVESGKMWFYRPQEK
ncbi:MAG: CHAP domain-containing protein [Bacteroidales bacterium]